MNQGPFTEKWCQELICFRADLDPVDERILSLMEAAGYEEKDLFSMRLALEEAVVNAIKHGNRKNPNKWVHIRYAVGPDQVLVEIEDQGSGFDPETIPDPLDPENLECPTGRGVFLMRFYMTWIKYNGLGNCVTLCKRKKK